MTSKKILNILVDIRNLLIDYIEKNNIKFKSGFTIGADYDIIEFHNAEIMNIGCEDCKCDIYGYTIMDVKTWNNSISGVKTAQDTVVEKIGIRLMNDNNEYLSLVAIIYTFLHELAHTITTPEQHNSNKIKLNVKQKIKY